MVINTTDQPKSTCNIDGINYKTVTTNLFYNVGCRIDLDRILSDIGKRYWIIEYRLEDDIDIDALKSWSKQQAGLSPGSSTSSNGVSTNIEYKFLDGKLRVCASKYSDKGKVKGKFYLVFEHPLSKWFPHKVITSQHILGFILGNISPRSMMNLHMKSMDKTYRTL